jgi:hypothetical protein
MHSQGETTDQGGRVFAAGEGSHRLLDLFDKAGHGSGVAAAPDAWATGPGILDETGDDFPGDHHLDRGGDAHASLAGV